MDKIIEKEYRWGKVAMIRISVGCFVLLILGILLVTVDVSETPWYELIAGALFILVSIIGLIQYFYMIKTKTFIKVTKDEIVILPRFGDFVFSSDVIEWKDVSGVENEPTRIILILKREDDIKIRKVYLNKNDRDDLLQIINGHIEKNQPLK
jgi:energy-coupling factor transporter transmembrane protein EcfT